MHLPSTLLSTLVEAILLLNARVCSRIEAFEDADYTLEQDADYLAALDRRAKSLVKHPAVPVSAPRSNRRQPPEVPALNNHRSNQQAAMAALAERPARSAFGGLGTGGMDLSTAALTLHQMHQQQHLQAMTAAAAGGAGTGGDAASGAGGVGGAMEEGGRSAELLATSGRYAGEAVLHFIYVNSSYIKSTRALLNLLMLLQPLEDSNGAAAGRRKSTFSAPAGSAGATGGTFAAPRQKTVGIIAALESFGCLQQAILNGMCQGRESNPEILKVYIYCFLESFSFAIDCKNYFNRVCPVYLFIACLLLFFVVLDEVSNRQQRRSWSRAIVFHGAFFVLEQAIFDVFQKECGNPSKGLTTLNFFL
jgi:hypothetical protein